MAVINCQRCHPFIALFIWGLVLKLFCLLSHFDPACSAPSYLTFSSESTTFLSTDSFSAVRVRSAVLYLASKWCQHVQSAHQRHHAVENGPQGTHPIFIWLDALDLVAYTTQGC